MCTDKIYTDRELALNNLNYGGELPDRRAVPKSNYVQLTTREREIRLESIQREFCKAFEGSLAQSRLKWPILTSISTQRVAHLLPVGCAAVWMLKSQCQQWLIRIVYLRSSDVYQDQTMSTSCVLSAADVMKSCEKKGVKSQDVLNKGS